MTTCDECLRLLRAADNKYRVRLGYTGVLEMGITGHLAEHQVEPCDECGNSAEQEVTHDTDIGGLPEALQRRNLPSEVANALLAARFGVSPEEAERLLDTAIDKIMELLKSTLEDEGGNPSTLLAGPNLLEQKRALSWLLAERSKRVEPPQESVPDA